MHLSCRLPVCFATALGLFAIAGPLTAQVSVELGPVVGYYVPMPAHAGDGVNAPGNFGGVSWGGELTAWLPRRLGVRAELLVAPRNERDALANPAGFQPALSGRVTVGGLLATYDPSADKSHAVWLAAGPGFVGHNGEAFDQSGDPTNLAGVAEIGATLPLATGLHLTFGGSILLHSFRGVFGAVGGPPVLTGFSPSDPVARRFQCDGLVHVAFTWDGP